MARKHHIVAPIAPRRPLVRRAPRAPQELSMQVECDLAPDAPVTEAELDAIERLLGDDLNSFLRALV